MLKADKENFLKVTQFISDGSRTEIQEHLVPKIYLSSMSFFSQIPKLTRDEKFLVIFFRYLLLISPLAQLDTSIYGMFSLMRTRVLGHVLSK